MTCKSLADISDRQAVDQNVQYVVDNDDQPASQPGLRVRMKTGLRTFGPGSTARPRPVLQPRDIARQVPSINDEMRAAYRGERIWILGYEEKRKQIKDAMHQRSDRPLRFLDGHPLALQQVVANCVSD